MQNYFVIISDMEGNIDWKHPNEINGTSKEDVYNVVRQDVPKENIIEILTEDEYVNKYINKRPIKSNQTNTEDIYGNQNLKDLTSDQFQNGNDFFNTMLKAGEQVAAENEAHDKANKKEKNKRKSVQTEKTVENKQDSEKINIDNESKNEPAEVVPPKYFEEGGIQFKLDNGVLYKKVWKQILLNGQHTPDGNEVASEYRIVNAITKRPSNVDKIELQHLEWEEIKIK